MSKQTEVIDFTKRRELFAALSEKIEVGMSLTSLPHSTSMLTLFTRMTASLTIQITHAMEWIIDIPTTDIHLQIIEEDIVLQIDP